ncbi:UDP-N-acetylmuramoyl-L-alanyl-D-glutamate--2,6-diaminopimelate ligase [Candidatus Peregrinibacteria bacterium]|nr:UDP-N-acetylmuramoyl-L-alanyl-D-glutamate--2,6-diaminopimelate ligase [Candidatus Peregrinibacteria bacterium]
MLSFLREIFPDTHPIRLFYHKVAAFIAALINLFPGSKMIIIGVTGTNGKTTTVNLLANILTSAGYKIGMTSTINFQIGGEKWTNTTKQSTMSPFKLQSLLKQMLKEGCRYVILEVTSHAITQSRVLGINFDMAVITNVTGDHIEYHGNFNNYLSEKGKLFQKVSRGVRKLGVPKVLVLNADDKYYTYFNQFVADRKITYSLSYATVYAENIEKGPEGSKFIMHVPNEAIDVKINLPGEFNVYNAMAAACAAIALQIPLAVVKKGLEEINVIPGRYEHVDVGQKFSVIVDYAHTPDALESLFALYRTLTPGKLFAVFGATGGGRDKSKRPKMGESVNEYADFVIVTNDDPYTEDEWNIIEQVSNGIPRKEGQNFWKIPDRREAIRLSLTLAKEGDCVVVAGKGAEEIIILKTGRIPWNDKKVITELLERE